MLARTEVLKLDFGTTNSPVWPGFTRVTEKSPMLSGAGKMVSFWRTTPDDLAGDGIVAVQGDFRLEFPMANGTYRVWVLSGDSVKGGSAEIKHLLQEVRIRAQGKRAFAHQRDLWYAEGFDYDPRADVWERYAGTNRFLEAEFRVAVRDQTLRLDFEGMTGTRQDYAFPLNAVVVFPEPNRDRMLAELAAIRVGRRQQWQQRFPEMPSSERDGGWTPDAESSSRGYAVWWRDYLEAVYPNTTPRPAELLKSARTFATPGEWEPLTLCLRSLTDLSRVRVNLSDLEGPEETISRRQIQACLVRYTENVLRSGAWYPAVPWALIPWNDPDIPANVTRQCWLKVHVPADAGPGRYRGRVTLAPANAAPLTLEYEFQVLPFALDRAPSASFFYFGDRRQFETDTSERRWSDNPRWWELFDAEASNLVAHGFVPAPVLLVGGPGNPGTVIPRVNARTNLVGLDWSGAERTFNWMKRRGYLPRDGYITVQSGYGKTYCGGGWEPYTWNRDPNYSNLFCQITTALAQGVQTRGWGTPVFEWGGELSNFGAIGVESAAHAYGALKSCNVLTALRGNGWVDWAVIATNRLIDFPVPNIALLRDAQTTWITQNSRELWLYNYDATRYGFGFFAWAKGATRRLHEGHLNLNGAPWDRFDGDHYQWEVGAEATRNGVAPLVTLQWMSEGRDDYDYVRTLEQRLAETPAHAGAESGREALAWIRQHCVTDIVYRGDPSQPGSVREAVNWRELQPWRALVAQAILGLQP